MCKHRLQSNKNRQKLVRSPANGTLNINNLRNGIFVLFVCLSVCLPFFRLSASHGPQGIPMYLQTFTSS